MSHKLVSADNQKVKVECLGCALAKKEIETIGGFVLETDLFTLSQDFEVPIPGFMILASKRHFRNIAQLTNTERSEFTDILIKARKAMSDALDINEVTIIQEEKSENSHFHVWLFPWYAWMKEVGNGLSSIKQIMEYSRINQKTEDNLSRVKNASEKIRIFLNK